MSKIYYLAHPYSGDVEGNVNGSIEITNELLDLGYYIFNPLTHSHSLDIKQSRHPKFWYDMDIAFLSKCDGIIMCPEWENSFGCRKEIKYAKAIGKSTKFPILFYKDLIGDGS